MRSSGTVGGTVEWWETSKCVLSVSESLLCTLEVEVDAFIVADEKERSREAGRGPVVRKRW
jgi:hypothetical protein